MTSLGITFPVRGNTNAMTETTGSFDWEVFDAGCGSWTGHFIVADLDAMAGNSRFSTVGCANPAIFTGVISMTKVGSAAPLVESTTGSSSFGELVREIEQRP